MPLEYSEASGHSLQQPLPGCIEKLSNKKITMWQMTNAANACIWRCFTPHNFCASTQQFIWQGMLHSCQVKSAQDVGKINRENWKSSILDWSCIWPIAEINLFIFQFFCLQFLLNTFDNHSASISYILYMNVLQTSHRHVILI